MRSPSALWRKAWALAALAAAIIFVSIGSAGAAVSPVGLGTAKSFAVLAGSTVTNTGPSTISGDLGVSPGTAVTGFPPGTVTNGTIHAADAVAAQAQADVTTAYNDAAGRPVSGTITSDLGGQTLVGGVYRGPTLGLTGTLTLDAQNVADTVWIFQAGSMLTTASGSVVRIINGGSVCNVFWQIGSSATLGTNSTFLGTLMALTAITAQTGAGVNGRLLARNAAVTLDTNNIIRPDCATPPATTTTAGGGAATTTAPGGGGVTTTTALGGGGAATTTTAPGGGGGGAATTTTAPGGGGTSGGGATTTTTAAQTTPALLSAGSTATTLARGNNASPARRSTGAGAVTATTNATSVASTGPSADIIAIGAVAVALLLVGSQLRGRRPSGTHWA